MSQIYRYFQKTLLLLAKSVHDPRKNARRNVADIKFAVDQITRRTGDPDPQTVTDITVQVATDFRISNRPDKAIRIQRQTVGNPFQVNFISQSGLGVEKIICLPELIFSLGINGQERQHSRTLVKWNFDDWIEA